jgi:cytochrome P450
VKNSKSELYQLYHNIVNGIFKDVSYLLFPIIDHIPFMKRYELHSKVAQYNKFVDNLVDRRKNEILEGKANKDNLLTQFAQASIPLDGKEALLTPRELRDNLKIFFIAGHDTTANTITAIIYYLARYPEIQEKLRAEVIEVMGKSDKTLIPNNEQLKKMEYLNMIIKETIRIMTTAAVLDRRADKPFTFSNGVHVPAGKVVSIHMWGLLHSPKYYPDPDKFDPERFRDPNCEANKNWMPFLIGSRTCK